MATKLITGSRVVVITGGARGIGLATAKALRAAGAKVAIGDVSGAEEAAAALGPDVFGGFVDVTDPESFESFIAAVEAKLGPVDVLDNNAGIMPIGPFLDETAVTARRVLEINVLGCLNGMKAVLPGMLARGRGHIINTASVAGKAPVPGGLTYAASKAAIVSATESARVEYAKSGLSFTCVMPSFTNTDLVTGTKGTKFIKNVEPEDVAAAIVDVIADPKPDVYVPAILGGAIKVQGFVGRRVRDAMQRSIGAYDTFLQVDHAARANYDNRIASGSSTPRLDAPDSPGLEATTPAATPEKATQPVD